MTKARKKNIDKLFRFTAYSPSKSFEHPTPWLLKSNGKLALPEDEPLFVEADIGGIAMGAFYELSNSFGQKQPNWSFGQNPTDKVVQDFINDSALTYIVSICEALRTMVTTGELGLYTLEVEGSGIATLMSTNKPRSAKSDIENHPEYGGTLIEEPKLMALEMLGLNTGSSGFDCRSLGSLWLKLTKECFYHEIEIEKCPIDLKRDILCALCLVTVDNIINSFSDNMKGLAKYIMELQELSDLASMGSGDNEIIRHELLSAQGRKAAVSKHENGSKKLKEFAVAEYQRGGLWKNPRQASRQIFPRMQEFAKENGIPTFSEDRGPDTVYAWLRGISKGK